jgi:hypothetical protein
MKSYIVIWARPSINREVQEYYLRSESKHGPSAMREHCFSLKHTGDTDFQTIIEEAPKISGTNLHMKL